VGKDFSIEEASIADIVRSIESRRMTCERLVEEYLERISAFDKRGPSINALISINEKALDEAKRLDRHFEASGLAGSLHGVPIVLKDNFDVEDLPTTAGSNALKEHVPLRDAFVVGKLRNAGAIVLGKANLHEFALGGTTVSSLGGQTRNPYDLTRTPGGSSGGTGAAVAANYCVAGLGSDTVNSIRSPASAQNLVGFRPTWGLLSRSGVVPVSPTQDVIGPITRSVRDAATLLDCMIGYDRSDPATAWGDTAACRNYSRSSDDGDLAGIRIGVWESLFGDGPEHAEVSDIVGNAVKVLEKAGAKLVAIENPRIDVTATSRDFDVQRFEFKEAINRYLASSRPGASVGNLEELIKSRKFHPGLDGFLNEANSADPLLEAKKYHARLVGIAQFRNSILSMMADLKVDALAYPLQKRLVVPIGYPGQPDRNGIIAALTGFPAINVQAGFSSPSQSAPIGVPVGMDLLGRPWSEHVLLNIAFAFESHSHFRKPPPLDALA
jgi:amidase